MASGRSEERALRRPINMMVLYSRGLSEFRGMCCRGPWYNPFGCIPLVHYLFGGKSIATVVHYLISSTHMLMVIWPRACALTSAASDIGANRKRLRPWSIAMMHLALLDRYQHSIFYLRFQIDNMLDLQMEDWEKHRQHRLLCRQSGVGR